MKPKNLSTVTLIPKEQSMTADERFAALGPIAKRHGRFPKGTVLPETFVLTCPRVKIADLPKDFIPTWFYEKNLEHNQKANICCRHPENHEIDAGKSHPEEPAPDRYNLYCSCGRTHRVFMAGYGRPDGQPDRRPTWEAS